MTCSERNILIMFQQIFREQIGDWLPVFPQLPFRNPYPDLERCWNRLFSLGFDITVNLSAHSNTPIQARTHAYAHTRNHTHTMATKGFISFPLSSDSLQKQKEIAQKAGKREQKAKTNLPQGECGLDSFFLTLYLFQVTELSLSYCLWTTTNACFHIYLCSAANAVWSGKITQVNKWTK